MRADGSLDYPVEIVRELDVAAAPGHSVMGQEREGMTQCIIRAMRICYVTVNGKKHTPLTMSGRWHIQLALSFRS